MRAWVEEIDGTKEAHIHAVDRRDLETHQGALRQPSTTPV